MPANDYGEGVGRRSLTLTGEIDLTDARKLARTVLGLCQEGAHTIALDLTEVAFLDSTGFQALLTCRAHCEEYCCELELTRFEHPPAHVFDMAGLLRKAAVPVRRLARPRRRELDSAGLRP